MNNPDPLQTLERLSVRLKDDRPPAVHVVTQVMERIRAAEAVSERTLALFAMGACVAAATTLAAGFFLLSELPDPLGTLFQVVPPIGL